MTLEGSTSVGTALSAKEPRLVRVLYGIDLDPGQKFGSLEEQILFLARAFKEHGSLFLPVFFCDPAPGRTAAFDQAGLQAECLSLRSFGWATLRKFIGLIDRHQIDVVHWNFSPPITNRFLWALTLFRPRLRHYFTDHNSRTSQAEPPKKTWKTSIKKLMLKRYQRVLCISDFILGSLQSQGTWSNLSLCPHFINTERFHPDTVARNRVREELKADHDFVLACIAYLIPEKGVDVALRALAEAPPQVVLWLIGDGPERGRLEELTRSLGLEKRVKFLGMQRNVEPYLQAADGLVCPSLWAEAAGLVNLEAQASGLPVLASAIGGIPELVADGRTGLLFPPGDHHQLAIHLRRLIEHPEEQRQMSQAARTWAVEQFSPESRLGDYLDLYRA